MRNKSLGEFLQRKYLKKNISLEAKELKIFNKIWFNEEKILNCYYKYLSIIPDEVYNRYAENIRQQGDEAYKICARDAIKMYRLLRAGKKPYIDRNGKWTFQDKSAKTVGVKDDFLESEIETLPNIEEKYYKD